MNILKTQQLSKIYTGKVSTHALRGIDLTIEQGEFVGIMGPSGSGKSTLLNIVSTIDSPSSGKVFIKDNDPFGLDREKLARFRRKQLGFVFQEFNLLDTLTIAENIVLPLTLDNQPVPVMDQKLRIVAEKLGILDILDKRTFEVSGGQKQRAAIGRAIIHSPTLLLADEPTGALDSKASRQVMEMMKKINDMDQTTILLVTHDPLAASYCHRVLFIKDGKLCNEIHCGKNRQTFFQEIIDMLSFLGGESRDLSSIRV